MKLEPTSNAATSALTRLLDSLEADEHGEIDRGEVESAAESVRGAIMTGHLPDVSRSVRDHVMAAFGRSLERAKGVR